MYKLKTLFQVWLIVQKHNYRLNFFIIKTERVDRSEGFLLRVL